MAPQEQVGEEEPAHDPTDRDERHQDGRRHADRGQGQELAAGKAPSAMLVVNFSAAWRSAERPRNAEIG